MKKFEKIFGIITIIALVMKLFLIPGAGILLTLSLSVLSCFYFLFGFAFFNGIKLKQIFQSSSYKGISALRIIGSIGLGIGLSEICMGILFKIQHWPGAHLQLHCGLLIILIILIVALFQYFKSENKFYPFIFKRIAIIGGFGFIMFLLTDLDIVKIMYRNHPSYIKTYEEYRKDPQNEELIEKLDIEYYKTTMSPEEFEYYMKYRNEHLNAE